MSTTPSDPRRAAENALWSALEDRRDQIRAAGLGFSERQFHQMREAHDDNKLLHWMCRAMENYPGDGKLGNLAGVRLEPGGDG